MDWGFLETVDGENKFLREETVYSSTVSLKLSLAGPYCNLLVKTSTKIFPEQSRSFILS